MKRKDEGGTKLSREQRQLERVCALLAAVGSPFLTIEVRGRLDLLADATPAVFAANHRSLSDFLIGLPVMGRIGVLPGILVTERFLPGPLRRLATGAGVIPVGKGGGTEAGAQALKSGRSLMVMPEGKLYWDPSDPAGLGRIKPGAARIARQSGRPVVPVAVDGSEKVWPKGSFPRINPFRRKQVVVTIGEPMNIQSDNDQAEAERFMASVSTLLAVASRTDER